MKLLRIDSSIFLLALIVLVLTAGILLVAFSARTDPIAEALSGNRIINTLIILSDKDKPITTSVVMYYPETKRSALFDIPGQLGFIFKNLGKVDRIDRLYRTGDTDEYRLQIESLLGLQIPFCLDLDVEAFRRLVDLMDGITIFVPDAIEELDRDPPVLMPAGTVRLDGDKAVSYLLYDNEAEDESLLIARRQRLNLALLRRLTEQHGRIASTSAWQLMRSHAHTNVKEATFLRLLNELDGMDVERILPQRVAGNVKEVSGQFLIFPFYDGSLIKDIVRQSLASISRGGEDGTLDRVHTVEVLNGTASQGLARNTANLLQGFGYDTVNVANAERNDHDHTEIIDRSGNEEAARVFAAVIKCDNIRTEARPVVEGLHLEDGADFILIIGKDFNGRYVVK